ncbi:MAG: hypothetical protein R2757_04215 [Draconibacterium sp.]
MNRIANIVSSKNAFIISLVMAAFVLAVLAPKAAVNVDEQLHYPHAKKVVNWYFTGGKDASCLDTPVTNLKYYGQSVDNVTALVNRVFNIENEFLTRHFTGAIFFWLLLLFAGLIGYQLSGSYWVSALTIISILVMPRLFGQAFGNLKDIPFATGYMAGIYMIIRFLKELPSPRWKTAIGLAVAIAFTSSVRIGGLILFAYTGAALLFYFILKPFLLKHIVSTKLCLVKVLGQGITILVIGYFGGLLFWPFALQDVFRHPLQSLGVMEHYVVSIRQIFEGEFLWSTQLSWNYLPKWLLISTPEFIFLGLLVFFILFFRKIHQQNSEQLFIELFLLFTLFFPLVYVLIIKANLYSGIRQLLFVLPLFAVLSSVGIVRFLTASNSKVVKWVASVFFFGLMILPLKHQAATFPADYIYFNSISGGNKKAWSNFEYDYYFHGIKKPSEYLIQLIGDGDATVACNCNLSNYFEGIPNIKYTYIPYSERSSADWDYALFGVNYIHPELLKAGNWQSSEIIKTFYHRGNPIAVILKRGAGLDFQGIKNMESGNTDAAEYDLLEAVKKDENNVWLLAQLAKIAFKEKDFESFNRYLQSGREIYPDYEPFYLLEANYWFENDDYQKAKETLNQLLAVNPRYVNAEPLLNAVNEKIKTEL